jgi:hypothetical protein
LCILKYISERAVRVVFSEKSGMGGGAGQSYPKKEDIDAGAGQPFPKKKKALPDEVYRALRGFFA